MQNQRWSVSAVVALLASLQVFLGVPRISQARVDPLGVIRRQINKANVLVVLDTSGSMTGVPGGEFSSSTEVGVDCDNASDCRGWPADTSCSLAACAPAWPSGSSLCPSGQMPDPTTNLVKNSTFAVGTGAFGPMAARDFNNPGLYTGRWEFRMDPTNACQKGIWPTPPGFPLAPGVITARMANPILPGGTIPFWGGDGSACDAADNAFMGYMGDNRKANDNSITIVNGNHADFPNWPGFWDPDTGLIINHIEQKAFPGDPCLGTAASNTWLFVNGNEGAVGVTGNAQNPTWGGTKGQVMWEQDVVLDPSTTYAIYAYVSNAANAKWGNVGDCGQTSANCGGVAGVACTQATIADCPLNIINPPGLMVPTVQALVDNVPVGVTPPLPNEAAIDGVDRYYRLQYSTTTAAGAPTPRTITFKNIGPAGQWGNDVAFAQPSVRKCIPIPNLKGACKIGGAACDYVTTCPATSGVCAASGQACTNIGSPCDPTGTCAGTGIMCSVTADCVARGLGGGCTGGICAGSATTCVTPGECPLIGSGTCSTTGVACTGTCAPVSRCALDTTRSCTQSKDCVPASRKYCSVTTSKSCKVNADCPASGEKCSKAITVQDWCLGAAANVCVQPHAACNFATSNMCNSTPNICAIPEGGACGNTKVGVRMCQKKLTVCTLDSDCGVGDTCGKPTSRAVIAKRVLQAVIEDTAPMVNYGLMSFYNKGYYQYFNGVSTAPPGTVSNEYYSRLKLKTLGCYDKVTGPTSTCVINGTTYSLKAANAFRYYIQMGLAENIYVDVSAFCGETCAPPGYGSGELVGASYWAPVTFTGANAGGRIQETSYKGLVSTCSGANCTYYSPNSSFYNGGSAPTTQGFSFPNCGSGCGKTCGGYADVSQVPFLDVRQDLDGSRATASAVAIGDRLRKAKFGGLITYASTPTGCSLWNGNATVSGLPSIPAPPTAPDPTKEYREQFGAYEYMQKVIANLQSTYSLTAAQAQTCRPNYVMLVTDGVANGPGDDLSCSDPFLCGSIANPGLSGCTCKAVLAAKQLRTLGVNTLVVGFGGDSANKGSVSNENIAMAGGTDANGDGTGPFSYTATSEEELQRAMRAAVLEAARGSYATSPPATSSGVQGSAGGIDAGKFVLDTRVDFPSWQGHLIAYDVSSGTPTVVWDASTQMALKNWYDRRVYIGDPSKLNGVTKVLVDPSTKVITNAAELKALGLGSSDAEASDIARWMLGDPLMGNIAVLGAMVNATPIDVGPPGLDLSSASGTDFFNNNNTRPFLTYVGSDDGMLHAFFSKDAGTNLGGTEAFAFIPKSMLSNITSLFAKGGQNPDPTKHVFGLASSAKVKNICTGSCASVGDWKTILVMTAGFGGADVFALDITNPVTLGVVQDPPVKLLWSAASSADATKFTARLGQTISVPAFNSPAKLDSRIIMASGYPVSGVANQGKHLVQVNVADGVIKDEAPPFANASNCTSSVVDQDYAALTDMATARDWKAGLTKGRMLSAYFGDTWGGLYRATGAPGETITQVKDFGCKAPLHFSPAVIQLDREGASPSTRGAVYLAQVTNSTLDTVTIGSTFTESRIAIFKDKTTFDDAAGTSTIAQGDFSSDSTTERSLPVSGICATYVGSVCSNYLPATARPAGSPTALLKADGSGFLLITSWYQPTTNGCDRGTTYIVVHQIMENGDVSQKLGVALVNEAVMGVVIAANKVWVSTATGLLNISNSLNLNVAPSLGSTGGSSVVPLRYNPTGWTEVP